jgi:hypothetical protein
LKQRANGRAQRVISLCTRAYQKPSVVSVLSVLSVRAFYKFLTILWNRPNDSHLAFAKLVPALIGFRQNLTESLYTS